MIKTNNKGITLIALVVTIIVLLILAGVTIATLTGDNGILTQASFTKFSTQMATLKEELELYKGYQKIVNTNFSESTLTAAENTLSYNTKEENERGNINDCLPSLAKSQYAKNIEIIKGKLVFVSQDTNLLNLAQKAGLEINPYLIVEGELLSSDINLLLMDDTGTLVIPDRVTKIGDGAFRGLEGLKTIVIPGSVKEIGNHAFSGNTTLENVIINYGVQRIGEYAFESCDNLKEVQIPNSVTNIGQNCFANCTALQKIKIPGSVSHISNRLLIGCSGLEQIELEEGITSIDAYVISSYKITNIKLPSTINNISSAAFGNMSKLVHIDIPSSNQYYQVQNGMLLSADGQKLYTVFQTVNSLEIPSSVKILEAESFVGCFLLTTITIPESVEIINTAFNSKVKEIKVDSSNTNFKSINGSLYNYDSTILYKYVNNEEIVNLPNTLKEIKGRAFEGQNSIREINLPDSLEKLIDWGIFYGLSITKLKIPKNVSTISSTALTGLNINIEIDKDNATYKSVDDHYITSKDGKILHFATKNLTTYYIPSSVEILNTYCFRDKSALTSIIIPSNVKEIKSSIFSVSNNLQKVEVPSSVQKIDSMAFSGCTGLKEIIIDKKEGEIVGSPWGCSYGLRAVKWKQ